MAVWFPALLASLSSAERKIVFLLHIHKSAGSTLCEMAGANGEIVNTVANCNVQQNQRCCGGDSLLEHRAYARTSRYTFVAAEGPMYSVMDHAHFEYVVIMRRSIDRYYSHYRHVERLYRGGSTFEAWMDGQPDNWNVRQLCGTRCLRVPKFKLAITHYLYTLNRMRAFDFVIRLDHFQSDLRRFAGARHWSERLDLHVNPGEHGTGSPNAAAFRAMTYLDDALAAGLEEPRVPHELPLNYSLPCGAICTQY